MSDDLVAAAARQHLPSIKLLVRDLLTLPINYSMAKMRTGLSAAYIQVMWNEEVSRQHSAHSMQCQSLITVPLGSNLFCCRVLCAIAMVQPPCRDCCPARAMQVYMRVLY